MKIKVIKNRFSVAFSFAYPLLFVLGLCGQSVFSQEIFWQKTYGGQGYDEGMELLPLGNGSFILAGETRSYDGTGRETGHKDIMVMKVGIRGNIIWKNTYGGSKDDFFSRISITEDGGFIIVGTTLSNDGIAKGNHGNMDFLVVKLDPLGNLVWSRCYGGSGNDQGEAVIEIADGGYLVTGESGSRNGDMEYSRGMLDMWVAKLDLEGNIIKSKSLGSRQNERGSLLLEAKKDKYLIVGSSSSTGNDVSRNLGQSDIWVVLLSKNFDVIWENSYGGSGSEEPHYLLQNTRGEIVIGGTTFSDDQHLAQAQYHGLGDGWLFALDIEGRLLWSHCFGSHKSEGINSFSQTPDGGYVLAGMTNNKKFRCPDCKQIQYDGWIARLDSNRKLIWQDAFGGEQFEYLYGAYALPEGNYLALGYTESTKDDLAPLKRKEQDDFWLFQFGDPGKQRVNYSAQPYLTGYVFSKKNGEPIEATILLTHNESLKKAGEAASNEENGIYSLDLPGKGLFSYNVTAPGHLFYGEDIDIQSLEENPEFRKNVMLDPLEVGSKVVLNHIYFDPGQWELKKDSRPELYRLLNFMQLNPNVKIEISGHTDNTGNVSQKEELSLKRAEKVRDFLLKAGVSGRNMQVKGAGMSEPVASNDTLEGRAQNRRVEVKVIEIR